MEILEQTTDIIKIEEVTSTMQNSVQILSVNKNLVTKATEAGQTLVDTAASGMSEDLDTAMNDWQVKAKQALKIMNERRAPITQLMTRIAKEFTSLEAKIDPAKGDSIFAKIQNERNSWARQKAEEARKKQAEIQRKQDIANEKAELSALISKQIADAFNAKLYEFKAFYTKKFNEITLDNFEENVSSIKNARLSYPLDKYNQLPVNVSAVYMDQEDLLTLINVQRENLYNELNSNFTLSIEVLRDELLEKVPSKKAELERISKASEAEAQRLLEEKRKREEEEEQRLKRQQIKDQEEADRKIAEQKEFEKVNTLFTAQTEMADIVQDEKPVRESYNIEVLNYAGWMQIASFWFEREGKTLAPEKFEKKTLGQMKAFAEKAALKDEKEKISSSHLVYQELFKAVVKK